MENTFKLRFSRMFRGSFGSCRTGNLSDVVEKAVFVPQSQKDYFHFHMMEPLHPKVRSFPSICGPKCPETTTKAITNSIFPRQKISGRYPPFISMNVDGHTCPPASPASPLNPFYRESGFKKSSNSVKNKKKKKKKNNGHGHGHFLKSNRRDVNLFSSSSQDSAYFEGSYWFSSEEDEDEREGESDTLFSSRSLSSDSSGSHRHRSRRKKYSSRRRRPTSSKNCSQMGTVLPLHGKVKDSFAVVKSSSDPYNDFRTSMVEMIVEKQIFAAKDLEQLLQCFLSLNSDHHHRIIVEVFTEIWEALFSNSC
ncbi:hypothetical protein JCGZ_07242 [Jatropha curcas]|uniref:Transcription repressor n=1 Tax=Jatropha curcas TaxID=180498 RepID=A0A067KBS3_JATCU|nr:transcription repressor OFP8 [Jatropha curcas]KDP33671.1 hypothetical protein JCGZ_07242 [Jatropha curcas]